VDLRQQAPWGVEGAVDERVAEDQLGSSVTRVFLHSST
jgi:hypothetical protein